jgi:H/ACA ribonucleoprotein complex subunit 2
MVLNVNIALFQRMTSKETSDIEKTSKKRKRAAASVIETEIEKTSVKKNNKQEVSTEETTATKDEDTNYEQKARFVTSIARPLAPKKLHRRLLRVVRKAAKDKDVKRGVKEVVKILRKGHHKPSKRTPHGALVILAGNVSPIDVLTHVPVLCEDNGVPYVYVVAKEDLGEAAQTKRPTACVMVLAKEKAEYLELFQECLHEIKKLSDF